MIIKNTFDTLTLHEVSVSRKNTGLLKKGSKTLAVLSSRKQIVRLKEIFSVLRRSKVDFEKLDDSFFAALSVYLCEERDLNYELLENEIRRLK
jgi:hypothetical protein